MCPPQLVENLATASKVVELRDASALCPLHNWLVCYVLASYTENRSKSVCLGRVSRSDTYVGCYTHSGPVYARFVGLGSECRVDLYKSEAIILKDEFSTLDHTILKGRCTPNISSNSSPKPRNYTGTRVNR